MMRKAGILAMLVMVPTASAMWMETTELTPAAGHPAGADVAVPECIDTPILLDECGDAMTGDLSLASGAGLVFPAGRLSADSVLAFDGLAVCRAGVALEGCGTGDITGVTAGAGLLGGASQGDAILSADTGYLQRRVAGACVPGQSIRAIDAAGGVVCEVDDGGVTSVAAGAGLSGGVITTAGTISVATGGITSAMIADGAVGTQDLAFDPATQVELNEVDAKRTVFTYAANTNSTTSGQWARMFTLGTMQKVSSPTAITISWHTSARATGNAYCQFEVRLNNLSSYMGIGTFVLRDPSGAGMYAPVSATSVFRTLDAGTYEVSVWAVSLGQNGGSCIVNPYQDFSYVIVEESGLRTKVLPCTLQPWEC